MNKNQWLILATVFILIGGFGLISSSSPSKVEPTLTPTPTSKNVDLEEGYKAINANDKFSFVIPENMKQDDVQGIDSFVQQYSGNNMTMSFDYGWYSNPLNGRESTPEFWQLEEKISGRDAKLIGYKLDSRYVGKYYSGIHFRNVESGIIQSTHLTMSVIYNNTEDKETTIKILKSIRLK